MRVMLRLSGGCLTTSAHVGIEDSPSDVLFGVRVLTLWHITVGRTFSIWYTSTFFPSMLSAMSHHGLGKSRIKMLAYLEYTTMQCLLAHMLHRGPRLQIRLVEARYYFALRRPASQQGIDDAW